MSSHRFAFYHVVAPVLSLFGSIGATAQPAVSLPTATASVGENVIIPIAFQTQQSSISGIQFDVEWDSDAMNLMAIAGNAVRNTNKRIYQTDISPGKKRFLIFGFNQTPMQSGVLADLFSNLQDEISLDMHSLKVTNAFATNQYGEVIDALGIDGAITVQENGGRGAKLKLEGVRNGGSLLPGPISPGEVITIFGSGIGPATEQFPSSSPSSLSLESTTLLFDGVPAPLLYAASDQINAVVPLSVSNKTSVQVQVLRDSQVLAEMPISVASTAPSIFTQTADGLGPATILNEDTTINTVDNPAKRGEVISFFATGTGPFDPLPVSVKIGGVDTEVLSATSAPSSVAGVLQVSCRVPIDLTSGPAVPVVLSIGSEKSQTGVTVSLQ